MASNNPFSAENLKRIHADYAAITTARHLRNK